MVSLTDPRVFEDSSDDESDTSSDHFRKTSLSDAYPIYGQSDQSARSKTSERQTDHFSHNTLHNNPHNTSSGVTNTPSISVNTVLWGTWVGLVVLFLSVFTFHTYTNDRRPNEELQMTIEYVNDQLKESQTGTN